MSFNYKNNKGYNLIEILLVLGIAAVVTLGAYTLYAFVNSNSKIEPETVKLQDLSSSILSSYNSSTNFNGISNQTLLADNVVPPSLKGENGAIVSGWGNNIRVIATDIVENGNTISNAGFIINYENVASKNCVNLVTNAGKDFSSIKIENQDVGVGANQNVGLVSQLCNRSAGAGIQFIYKKASTALAAQEQIKLCEETRPTNPETQSVSCPSGQYGVLIQTRTAFCTGNQDPYRWTNWATASSTCKTCPPAETRVFKETIACPTGQLGQIVRERDEKRTSNCPVSNASGPSGTYSWGDWTGTGSWREVSNTCEPICVLPTPSVESKTTSATGTCPSGQTGVNTYKYTEQRTWTCPKVTGSPVVSSWAKVGNNFDVNNTCTTCPQPNTRTLQCGANQIGSIQQRQTFQCSGTGQWNDWETTSNTCQTCPSPQSQSLSCPSNQFGTWTQSRSFQCSGSGSWGNWTDVTKTCTNCPGAQSENQVVPELRQSFCPAGTWSGVYPGIDEWRDNTQVRTRNSVCDGGANYSWGGWSGWSTVSSSAWRTTAYHCNSCPGNYYDNNYQWVNITEGCPAGYTGAITYQKQQQQNRLVSFNCPTGTIGYPAANYGGWSGWWDTGATQAYSNTCTPACSPRTYYYYDYSWNSCGANKVAEYGERRQLRTQMCDGTIISNPWETIRMPRCCSRTCSLN